MRTVACLRGCQELIRGANWSDWSDALCSFTGAYVFYWLLLLLLYMTAYFIATKSDTSNSKAIAQVLRQLVAFLIASKGYLDYVIWFAVNSIERYTAQPTCD